MSETTTTGRKRARSSLEVEEPPAADQTQTQTASSIPTSSVRIYALLLHFNTLISSRDAVAHVTRKTLFTVLPATDIRQPLLEEHIILAFARSPFIAEIVRELSLRDLTVEEQARLAECYVRIYYEEGTAMVRLATGAEQFLRDVAALRQRQEDRDDGGGDGAGGGGKMAIVVLANNTVVAEDMLSRLGVRDLVDAILPTRNPQNPSSFTSAESTLVWEQTVVPWFAESRAASASADVKPLLPEQAVVVSNAIYDLSIAKAIGCKTYWIRKVSPNASLAVRAAAEFTSVVESIGEVWTELFAEHPAEGNKEQPVGIAEHPIEDLKEQLGGVAEHPTEENKEQPGVNEDEEEGKMEGTEGENEQEPWIL
ncbi:uncharacterized protein B0T15DRAFT_501914 [Chaetomium strumarium]|uniref:Uncharacterized protein n=1 Tax=Chaetomium strumarium TaxID=1170767 RepID=A0AAJ0GWI7_9PEZI|nr:hypothetical protein B0T15DRAFT_501914 [Chaetomium strumarium]